MNDYKILEKKIKITFQDQKLLETAFVHRSYVNEHQGQGIIHNERLEFLGDAVLELVATRHLFFNYPDHDEGALTSFRSALVKGQHLADVANELSLGDYLLLSRGEEKSGGREKKYILGNTVEALIGAIYIEHGLEVAETFIQNFILGKLDSIIGMNLHIDNKTHFQEISQELYGITPHYELVEESGPDHAKKFVMGAYIGTEFIAEGKGSSKQKAEDDAAIKALKKKGW